MVGRILTECLDVADKFLDLPPPLVKCERPSPTRLGPTLDVGVPERVAATWCQEVTEVGVQSFELGVCWTVPG